jgi:hypothetical protein
MLLMTCLTPVRCWGLQAERSSSGTRLYILELWGTLQPTTSWARSEFVLLSNQVSWCRMRIRFCKHNTQLSRAHCSVVYLIWARRVMSPLPPWLCLSVSATVSTKWSLHGHVHMKLLWLMIRSSRRVSSRMWKGMRWPTDFHLQTISDTFVWSTPDGGPTWPSRSFLVQCTEV